MARFGIVLLCSCWAVFSLTAAESCVQGGVAVACNPPVQRNIAVGIAPVASNTCGQDGPERVCYRAGSGAGYAGQCTVCDAGDHPAALATDPHTEESLTYWQSQTYRSVQHPNTVTLTISLNKTYSVNSVSVLFQSARPESFSLSLSNDNGGSFTPLHYFSRSCNSTYGVAETTPGSPQQGDATGALCSSDGTQLVPLSGGRSVYSTTSYGRDPVSATDLRLELDRLNTFGDERSWDTEVLDSYYYAITDIAISGRCHCNGHAGSCVRVVGGGLECNCTHNTEGEDCQRCLPSHNDRPWSPAVEGDARECVECNCNGHSSRCHFDMAVYLASGNMSGGVCDDCQHNTSGRQCERCQEGFYPNPSVPFTSPSACLACACDPRGTHGSNGVCSAAESTRNASGHCACKTNAISPTCSTCREGYYNLSQADPNGCQACECDPVGSLGGVCNALIGKCRCKPGVGGDKCDVCLPGYYGFGENGCRACSCHSSGSVGSDCSQVSGQCTCRDGFSERDCSMCTPGTRRTEEGCATCPACYGALEESFNRTSSSLSELFNLISQSRNASLIDNDIMRRLNTTRNILNDLNSLVASLVDRERRLRSNMSELTAQVTSEQSRVEDSENLQNSAESAFQRTQIPLMQARMTLQNAINEASAVQNLLEQQATMDLARATEVHDMLQEELSKLIDLVNQTETISLEQQRNAAELFDRAVTLMNVSANRLSLLCDLLDRQNVTLMELRILQSTDILNTDDLLKLARPELSDAVTAATSIFAMAEQLREMVRELPRQDFMENQLLSTAESLQQRATDQLSNSRSLNEQLTATQMSFAEVNSTAERLLRESEELHRTASELMRRALAARNSANMSTTEGNQLIATAEQLLTDLRQRLEEVTRFYNNLQQLLEVIRRAENTSNMAANEARIQQQEVANATRLANEAAALLLQASRDIQQAMQVATEASSVAGNARQAAVSLQTEINQVPDQLATIESEVDQLQERAARDTATITETNITVTAAQQEAADVQSRVADITTLLDQLSAEINSSRLLSRERVTNINETLSRLLSRVEAADMVIETTAEQVDVLEKQTNQMRARYTELLHHRDLLLKLQESTSELDCSKQFRRFSG